MKPAPPLSQTLLYSRWLLPGAVLLALAIGWLASYYGTVVPLVLLAGTPLVFLVVLVFYNPRYGYLAAIAYGFLLSYLGRQLVDVPVGLGMEAILLLTWLAVVAYRKDPPEWSRLRNDLCRLTLIWFVINLVEIANPAGASIEGWFYDIRGSALLWLLCVPLGYLVLRDRRDLNHFLYLIIGLSVLGALYGIKQKLLGVDAAEQHWLNAGAARTHLIWGRLRVFSFYSEAAQFGSSQAHLALICGILALGPFSWPKRLLLVLATLLLLNGMLISGTRGAFFVLATGTFVYLALSKRIRVLILGCLLAAGAFGVLKYTHIGDTNASVYRMRSALDPNDPSLQVRLKNQAILREYLATRPLGGGLGVMGHWGRLYNPGKFLATVAPDSYFVKVWGQYGIVGFLIWFGIMLFILGKCMGIVWHIRDPVLRQKLLALTAGFAGILVCSYGNEIMNQMPSSIILYTSWVFVFLGPSLDTPPAAPADYA
ncbi:O-antigen ligase family protein [Hymenobacter saemangeumensis]|uniref:O-antigen ligase family protein n=1 Tax=Hymenobacter saemangeumensis TaxID=1084522 RepID=A0ABP8HWD4_9BACT